MSCITEIQGAVVVVIIWWCDLQLHMSYITEIEGAVHVVVVIIWWCDLQLHMSYITEIQEAVVVVIIWWCDLKLHMSYITEIQGIVVVVIIWWCDLQLHVSCEIQGAVVVVIIWWCDLQLHMSYITEIQGAVVVVMIWWCDLQLHMSYITEIQGSVVVVIIWWCDLQLHMQCGPITNEVVSSHPVQGEVYSIQHYVIMTYLTHSTSSHEGHWATTVSFHLGLFRTFLFAFPHVVFMACSSEIIPLRHEFFGLPLFLFPRGFHSKACFAMLLFAFLSVCPIHFHRLDLIVKLIGCCFVFHHSSLLLLVSCHLTSKIVLRQRFRKT